jgi:Flp pilus assembly CpaF family ATPase
VTATDVTLDESLVRRIRAAVATGLTEQTSAALASGGRKLDGEDQAALARSLINEQLERHAEECLARHEPVLTADGEAALAQAVYDRIFQLGRLQPLLDDERIMDIHANGCDVVFVGYADGTKAAGPAIAASDAEMIELLREIGRRHGLTEREFNASRPQLNVQLPDGSRLFATAWVCGRPCLAIRRHRYLKVDLADLQGLGAIDLGLASFLGAAVRARKQLMIAGSTGAGKTTVLRALASEIPVHERIVTIETELELGLDRFPEIHPDCVALEAREANVEGIGEVTAAELVRMSLRMDPDRVIVGEVRGDEVIPMLNAMSQGNDGSMCTIHADSSSGVFRKLALYAMQSPERLPMDATLLLAAAAIDLLVFIAKTSSGRYVASVRQVTGFDGKQVITNELFRPGPDGRAVPGTPIPIDLVDELAAAGYDPTLHDNPSGWWR